MSDNVGFIGLGRMGRPMAINMARKGFRLVVNDINAEAVQALADHQASPAATAAEVAERSGTIITMLPNSKIVEEVLAGAGGVFDNAAPGSLIMDMSTVHPETTDAMAKMAAERGMTFVDAPVGRLAAHADIGESLFMVGASDEDFVRVKPMLEAMGTTIHHCGPVGAGTRSKIVNNYVAISLCQLNAEALALSQRLGLDLDRTLDVLYGTTASNGQLRINWPAKVLAGDTEPGFTIDLAHKDLTLVMETANAVRAPMPVAAAAREAFSQARARGFGGRDFSGMLDALCDAIGETSPRLAEGSPHKPAG